MAWSGRLERVAGHAALRRAAAGALGIPSRRLAVISAPGRAPRIRLIGERAAHLAISVSITHRDGLVAAVADTRFRIGVDLERQTPIPEDFERYFLTSAERRVMRAHRATLWALKEAAWKALECDESTPLAAVELHFDEGDKLLGVSRRGTLYAATGTITAPWPGYVLAIVRLEGRSP